MKAETWIFVTCTVFFVLVAPAYWLITGDPTGTSALVMTALLTLLVSFYLGFHASRMEPRPEDRKDGEIADGAGELGFFPPYSWWPLWCGLTLGMIVLGVVIGWWLAIIGGVLGSVALTGLIFEYYRGEHAH
ncbi:cytochrome c oxidase subunit 4 [Marmoricola sp. RAF53]|uniref:cytochrome c oxidase subunit 4 n=1 Tax=Marmoricola sp. RAF53 TaxID=3233059 RepID=UPI003F9BB03F